MKMQFTIVRSENASYLCHKEDEVYMDVSNPMNAFVTGEDDFQIVEPDSSFAQKKYEFRGEYWYFVPRFYNNAGWHSPWKRWKTKTITSYCPSIWRK